MELRTQTNKIKGQIVVAADIFLPGAEHQYFGFTTVRLPQENPPSMQTLPAVLRAALQPTSAPAQEWGWASSGTEGHRSAPRGEMDGSVPAIPHL